MQEIVKDWFLSYGVILDKRFTANQKLKFIKRTKAELENMGYKTEVSETKVTNRGFGSKTYNNLYAGDIVNSDIVIYTYYDTPTKSFFNNNKFAFNSNYDKKDTIVGLFLGIFIIFVSCLILTNIIQPNIRLSGIFSFWGISFIALCVIAFSLINKYKYGIAEKNNIVRNSSSIIAIMTLAKNLEEEYKNRVCFAFIDEGTSSEIGLKILDKYLPKRKKIKIYLDSVGADGNINILSNIKYKSSNIINMVKKYEKYGDILITSGEFNNEKIEIKSTNYNDFEKFQKKNNDIVNQLTLIIKQILKK